MTYLERKGSVQYCHIKGHILSIFSKNLIKKSTFKKNDTFFINITIDSVRLSYASLV